MTDLFLIWFIIEISNFLFISFITINISNKKSTFFYFFIQIISSSILIIALISLTLYNISHIIDILLLISLILKLNIPPFHFWIIIIINYLNWFLIILILSIQKIIPFYILYFNIFNPISFIIIILLSIIIPPIISININNLKKIFLYSSINQTRWFLILIFLKNSIWFLYFLFYNFISFIIIKFINLYKLNFFFKLNNYLNLSILNLFLFFNLARLPPLIFIFFKWYNILIFIYSINLNLLFFILIFNSLIITFIYINIINISMYKIFYQSKFISPKTPFINLRIINSISLFFLLRNFIIII